MASKAVVAASTKIQDLRKSARCFVRLDGGLHVKLSWEDEDKEVILINTLYFILTVHQLYYYIIPIIIIIIPGNNLWLLFLF